MQRVQALAGEGSSGAVVLVDELTDPSWTVRRGVVAALARQGDAAVGPLCQVLTSRRDNEARLAAVVDALVLSKGDVERALIPLAGHADPAVAYDVALVLGRRRRPAATPVLVELIGHRDDNVAVAAIEGLGRMGGGRAVAALVAAATSGNFFRTFPAIDVLGRSGDPAAVAPLLALLEKPVYAMDSVRALGRTADERAIRPLIRLLTRPGDALARAVALALSDIDAAQHLRFGRPHVVGDALRAEPLPASLGRRVASCVVGADAGERAALCRVLGWIGGEECVASLVELLKEEPAVAQAASEALAEMGRSAERQILQALASGDSRQRLVVLPHLGRTVAAVPELLQCLEDPDAAVRIAACEALQRIGEPSAAPVIFPLLADPDPRVSQAALSAIQALGSPRTEALTLEAARSKEPRVRRAALRIIAYFGYPSGLDALLTALEDPDERLRDAATYGLPFLEDPRALEALLAAARHGSARTRAAAMRALGQCTRSPKVTDRLRGGLTDADPWVRYYAVQSLGKLGDAACAREVTRLLEDPAGQVRVAVVDALAHLNTDDAVGALRAAARSADPDVRRAAFLGLGLTRRPESLATLLSALDLPEAATRLVAVSAVAEFDAPEVLPALLRMVRDSDASVRNAAVGFLAARGGPGPTQELIRLLPDEPLRELVLSSLALPVEGRIPGLLAGLESADEALAPLLVGALARMHRPDARAAIFDALRTAGPAGRKAAAQAVASMGTPAATAALEQAAREDPDVEVRRLCTLALVP